MVYTCLIDSWNNGGLHTLMLWSEICLQSYGVDVERYPSSEMQAAVERHEKDDNMLYLHSFDDINLIRGHARYFVASSSIWYLMDSLLCCLFDWVKNWLDKD